MNNQQKNSLLFSNRALVSLSIPIIIDAILVIVAGLIDSAMVSSVGEAAVGAVSLIDSVISLIVLLFASMAYGGVVVTSQYIGNKDFDRAKTSAYQLLYSSTFVAIVTAVILLPFIPELINLIFPGLESQVFDFAKTYFFWVLLGIPFFAIGNSCTSLLRAQANSKLALALAGSVNILNVIGNAVLIFGFDMGVAGAAISTTFSRLVFAIVGIILLKNKELPVYFEKILSFKLNFDIMKRVLKIGSAQALETGLFQIGGLMISRLVSSFGTIAIAVNSVSGTLCNIGWTTVISIGTVLLTVVGQCMGAGKPEQAKMYTSKLVKIATVMLVVIFSSIFIFRNQLVLLFNFGEEAMSEAAYYTGVGALFAIFSVYSLSFVPSSAFRAAGDLKYTVYLSIGSMFTFRVALAFLISHFFDIGLMSVWIGMWADWTFRSVMNFIHFRRGKWLTKKVI